ncbi:DinB family protein [Actinomycetes bacterium KLBMP 9759]
MPTIARTTWHIGWWSSATHRHRARRAATPRTDVFWPGAAARTVERLRELRTDRAGVVDELVDGDLDAVATFPWQGGPVAGRSRGRALPRQAVPWQGGTAFTLGRTLAWVNTGLAESAADVGQPRLA